MEQVIYEDKPHIDIGMKLILALPVAVIVLSIILVIAVEPKESILEACGTLGLCLLLLLFFVFFIVPRAYIVCDSRIIIRMRGPFAFNIPFSTVKDIHEPRNLVFSINLHTNLSSDNALVIYRKRRMAVVITPSDRQGFITSFEKAYRKWQSYGGK